MPKSRRKEGSTVFLETMIIMTVAMGCLLTPSLSEAELTPQSRDVSIAKQKFLEESKKEAKKDWDVKLNLAMKRKYLSEEIELSKDRKYALAAEAEKARLQQAALEQAKSKLIAAQESAAESARQSKKLAEQIKKSRERKRKTLVKKLGNATVYNIGSAGHSEWKSFEFHTKENGSSTFGAGTAQRNLQYRAYTGKYGIRMVDGRYCAAIGSHFGKKVGTKFDVLLKNGNRIKCIMGDQKADRDTDFTNSYHVADGSYLEFIVDRGALASSARRLGTVGAIDEFAGPIAKIIVYSKG